MPEETSDSLELLDWIVAQPWCNGRVGLWGISYEGTRALLTGRGVGGGWGGGMRGIGCDGT